MATVTRPSIDSTRIPAGSSRLHRRSPRACAPQLGWLLRKAGCAAGKVAACGITSQRDTVFAWDDETGQPIGNAITWQDLRTVDLVAEVGHWRHAGERRAVGDFRGSYCSAMHMAWRMRYDEAFRSAARAGRLLCSLAAGWIAQALGRKHDHALDYSLMEAMTVFDFRRKHRYAL